MKSIKEAIKNRKSTRTFDDSKFSKDDLSKIEEVISKLDNPFNIPIKYKILDKKEKNLSSPVIAGEDIYIGAKVIPQDLWEIAYGYEFEKLCLLLEELNLGTTIIGGTFNRKAFEDAMDLEGNEIMPLATPVGHKSSKKTMKERLLRKAVKADKRLPFEEIFFNGSFDKPLKKEEAGDLLESFELTRLAPSAVNKQPWRLVLDNNKVHFYKESSKGLSDSPYGDVQKLDLGIAMANFDLTSRENGIEGEFIVDDPGLETNDNTEYIITYRRNN